MTRPDLEALSVDDARLRRVASDRAAVAEAAARAEQELASAAGGATPRLLGYLGGAYRLLGRHEDAIAAHERARTLTAAVDDARARAAALVRLGESYRCADRLEEAEETLREALALAPPGVAHFALQHLGKTLLDRGRHQEAEAVLASALELRRAAGDEELVNSTERALAAARAGAGEAC